MTREVKIREVNNGFQLTLNDDTHNGEYVYNATDIMKLMEKVGRFLYGKRVKVEEN